MNGIINVDSDDGKKLGFTSDKFDRTSYLFRAEDEIVISLITSRNEGQGNFRKLLETLEEKFRVVIVPTPSRRMRDILGRRGYLMTNVDFGDEVVQCLMRRIEP